MLNGAYVAFGSNRACDGALKYGLLIGLADAHVGSAAPVVPLKHAAALAPPNVPHKLCRLDDGAAPRHALVNELYFWMSTLSKSSTVPPLGNGPYLM